MNCRGIIQPDRRVLTFALGVLVLTFGGVVVCAGTDQQQDQMTVVHAKAEWYIARQEPEQDLRGTLHKRDAPAGPGARLALSYELATEDETIPVYAAGVDEILSMFEGRRVLVRGKLVDLSAEGFGRELWIGSISSVDDRHF
ncbi:MAG: hypothetical protein ACYSTY_12170 [Planctomycetota bacterium]|jgi:hypothetical protein